MCRVRWKFLHGFFLYHNERVDNMGFAYKEQYAVIVICEDQKEQEVIYNRLKAEGLKLKVVAV